MNTSTIRKALYRKVDEVVEGAIAAFVVFGSMLVSAAVLKAALLYLVR
jgi:hypothetical protein